MGKIANLVENITGILSRIPTSFMALLSRIVMASIFWKSAMTKIAFNEEGVTEFSFAQIWNVVTLNWTVADSTFMLFEYEYDLPIIPFELGAYMAVAGEILLPIALILGLFTRYAALGMFGMTMVIQIFVYPNLWPVHSLWAVALLIIMQHGGGRLSLDHFICKRCL